MLSFEVFNEVFGKGDFLKHWLALKEKISTGKGKCQNYNNIYVAT